MTDPLIKPCPFCGAHAVFAGCRLVCSKCGATGPTTHPFMDLDGRIACWNDRFTPPTPKELSHG